MRISIVTISLNQDKFLPACIDSISRQEYFNLEHIIVDPGSSDNSRKIIESYGDSVIPIFEHDEGPADGLNKGFAAASGDVYGFVNADDYLLPGALHAVCNHFEQYPADHFVSGCGYIEYSNGRLLPIEPSRLTLTRYLCGAAVVFQPATFFRRAAFSAVGGFNKENKTCWDGELFANFLVAGVSHRVIGNKLAVFRIHADSISGSKRLASEYEKQRRRIFRRLRGREPNMFDLTSGLCLRMMRRICMLLPRPYRFRM